MDFSVPNHMRQYGLSYADALSVVESKLSVAKNILSTVEVALSILTLSAWPIGMRHWEQASDPACRYPLAQRVICVLECIPVVGLLTLLVERVVAFACDIFAPTKVADHTDSEPEEQEPAGGTPVLKTTSPGGADEALESEEREEEAVRSFVSPKPEKDGNGNLIHPHCSYWTPRVGLSMHDLFEKMMKNAHKAASEHREVSDLDSSNAIEQERDVYTTSVASVSEEDLSKEKTPLTVSHTEFEAKGHRYSMEDAHLCMKITGGTLAGVFDGHGGAQVAVYVKEQFERRFETELLEQHGNVYAAFEFLFDKINKEVLENSEWNVAGTTAVVSFIDEKNHLIYTATIGDSETNIYREKNTKRVSIPLSVVRNWTSQKDAIRHAIASGDPTVADRYPNAWKAKMLRYPPRMGINVSRAIGDQDCHGPEGKPAVIHKPKITISAVKRGDVVILACDGLKDYTMESAICTKVKESLDNNADIAKALGDLALESSVDNVTIVAMQVS